MLCLLFYARYINVNVYVDVASTSSNQRSCMSTDLLVTEILRWDDCRKYALDICGRENLEQRSACMQNSTCRALNEDLVLADVMLVCRCSTCTAFIMRKLRG
jgi:hypothetical protein